MRIVTIQGKIADLRELGFADPVKIITSSPAILNYPTSTTRRRSGVAAPQTTRNLTMPESCGQGVKTIHRKYAAFRECGLAAPEKIITRAPPILGYAIDSIRFKIAELRELGFAD